MLEGTAWRMTGLRTRRRVRGAAALLYGGLLSTMLTLVVGPASPAAAAVCLDETVKSGLPGLQTGCDDVTPPHATLTAVAPAPNAWGYLRSTTVTVSFSGAHSDADTGAIGFECQMYDTATQPTTWTTCTSPTTYQDLEDSSTTPWTFRVRAVDTTDRPVHACDATVGIDGCLGDPDVEDVESPGAVVTARIDTSAPNTFLNRQPVDRIRPDWPVVLTTSPVLQVNSNEPATFACTVNGRAVKRCGPGRFALTGLAPGDTTVVARAVDRGSNLDPTPASTRFFVPSNITRSKGGWKAKRQAGLFGNDYVEATRVGQTLVITGIKSAREVRLIAPVGPTYGTIEVRVGPSRWYTVDLYAKKARIAQLLVRDQYTPARSGTIRIRVKELEGRARSVRLDALVARS
jgi:hypothetical protein